MESLAYVPYLKTGQNHSQYALEQVCKFMFHVKCKNKHEDASQKPPVVHTA